MGKTRLERFLMTVIRFNNMKNTNQVMCVTHVFSEN